MTSITSEISAHGAKLDPVLLYYTVLPSTFVFIVFLLFPLPSTFDESEINVTSNLISPGYLSESQSIEPPQNLFSQQVHDVS